MKGLVESIFLICSMLFFIGGGIVIGVLSYQNNIDFSSLKSFNENNYSIENCNNLSLSETAYCVRNYIKTFYNYTERDERDYTGNQGTLEDVKLNGGDCHDYVKIQKEIFNELGFQTKKISIFPDTDDAGHTFLIVWDNNLTGYCKLDLLNVDCAKFPKI